MEEISGKTYLWKIPGRKIESFQKKNFKWHDTLFAHTFRTMLEIEFENSVLDVIENI